MTSDTLSLKINVDSEEARDEIAAVETALNDLADAAERAENALNGLNESDASLSISMEDNE